MLLICFGVYTSCFTFASGNFWLRSFFFCFWNQLGHNKRQCRGTSHALSCIHVWLATYQVVLKRCSSYSTFCSVAPTRAISSSVLVWHASTNSCKTPDSSKQLWFIQVDVFPSTMVNHHQTTSWKTSVFFYPSIEPANPRQQALAKLPLCWLYKVTTEVWKLTLEVDKSTQQFSLPRTPNGPIDWNKWLVVSIAWWTKSAHRKWLFFTKCSKPSLKFLDKRPPDSRKMSKRSKFQHTWFFLGGLDSLLDRRQCVTPWQSPRSYHCTAKDL